MPHGASRRVHCLLTNLRVNDSHSNDSPQESLMWIGWLLTPESLQLLMVEEGLNPKIVIYPKSLELLSQREVGENHIVDLGRANQSSIKGDQICYDYLLSRRVVPSRPPWGRPSNCI